MDVLVLNFLVLYGCVFECIEYEVFDQQFDYDDGCEVCEYVVCVQFVVVLEDVLVEVVLFCVCVEYEFGCDQCVLCEGLVDMQV